MRLINTTTYQLRIFVGDNKPAYAVLSHCWGEDEVTLQDYTTTEATSWALQHGAIFKKIRDCCMLARAQDVEWVWIDTCCIDKTSSAELSEAINSMFVWYQDSEVCFALLEDAPKKGSLENCRWFTRGWTLQELLAPRIVQFFNAELDYLGDRHTLGDQIERITRIPREFLEDRPTLDGLGHSRVPLFAASVAQRMCWAATRSTTRTEDIAYCLLGLFNVNMPLLYGEGARAFKRLQENIVAHSQDESIFAWTSWDRHDVITRSRGILARSPSEFIGAADIVPLPFRYHRPNYYITARGLSIHAIPLSFIQRLIEMWRSGVTKAPDKHFSFELQCARQSSGQRVALQLSRTDHTYSRIAVHQLGLVSFERGYLESLLLGGYSRIYIQCHSQSITHCTHSVIRQGHLSRLDLVTETVRSGNATDLFLTVALILWSTWIADRHPDHATMPIKLAYTTFVWLILPLGWKWQKHWIGSATSISIVLLARFVFSYAAKQIGTVLHSNEHLNDFIAFFVNGLTFMTVCQVIVFQSSSTLTRNRAITSAVLALWAYWTVVGLFTFGFSGNSSVWIIVTLFLST